LVGEDRDDDASELPPVGGNHSEDIANFRNQVFDVDDDNEPAVENIPTGEEPTTNNGGIKEGQSWGLDGIDRRSIIKPEKEAHSYKKSFSPAGAAFSEVILHFLPLKFLAETVLTNTNDAIMAIGELELVWGEFARFLGILALMATVSGYKRHDFWCVDRAFDQRENHCPYRFNPYMLKRRFDIIVRGLCFTRRLPPRYADKFWQVRYLISAYNSHMATIFVSSWVGHVLDGFTVQGSHTHLETSIIPHVVQNRVSCFRWKWLRERTTLER
jgi:hypothetical protein